MTTFLATSPTPLPRAVAAAVMMFAGSLTAQIQAFYPLQTDLLDATTNYGPMTLTGNPVPAPPANGVCLNGVYAGSGGQDARTPILSSLDLNDFQVDVEFEIQGMPLTLGPVLMGGNSYRWLGIYLQQNGTVGFKHNNANIAWSTTVLSTGVWYAGSLRYEAGIAQLSINGTLVLERNVGPLNHGNNRMFTTNDYSNARAFHGCIRNLLILNDTSLAAAATAFGTGCAGGAGVPGLAAATLPQLGTSFVLQLNGAGPASGAAFLTAGLSSTMSPLGPLPLSLQPFGLAAGCSLLVSADQLHLMPVSAGTGSASLGVPLAASLSGLHLFFQAAPLDAAATGGIAISNGLDARVGS